MYTEERKRGSLLVNFILKLVLIIIFVLLLVWLVPWPNMDSLNPLKDQIFNANLQTMKEAGITYFTTERLPVEVGDKTTLTLQKMLDLKLLIPFTDKNGDSCDVTASYVSIEKQENEYLMKVNLKCGEEEDYILVHLGCYSYCEKDICEAKPESTEKPTTKPITTTKPTKTPTQKPTIKPTPTTKPTVTPTVTPVVEKEWEYKLSTDAIYSAWSNWTTNVYTDGIEFVKTDTKEVEDLGIKKEQSIVEKTVLKKVQTAKAVLEPSGTYTYKVCKDYKYEVNANTVYKVESDWAYVDRWYQGYNPPADTMTSRWIFQGVDFDKCGEDCENHPYVIYREQTRKVTAYTTYSDVTATCTDVEDRAIQLYRTSIKSELKTVKLTTQETVEKETRYYRVRTRNLLQEATTTYKWSTYNDQTLLSQGYVLTGKTRNK